VSATRRTRVLVCDGSPFAARFRRALEHDGDIEVISVHGSARGALAALDESAPDVVTIDLALPGLGLAAVEEIMSTRPLPIVVLSATAGRAEDAAAALAAGALDTFVKDELDLRSPDSPAAAALRRRVKILARAQVIRHPRGRLRRSNVPPNGTPHIPSRRNATHVAIAASTGGPRALFAVLTLLPPSFGIPVLVVQHMSPGFTGGLAHWLDAATSLPVRIAAEGDLAASGIWLAPENAHLVVREGGTLGLDSATPADPHRPSADVLFASLAVTAGDGAAAVVLSGMGDDGAAGTATVRAAGGVTIAQDEATSAIYGMPRAAAERGAEFVLALDEIAPALVALARGTA
jgi:two-component system chemotaxis response regulator CheB